MSDVSDNQIECPRCGASVYYELNICPECGLNFYQPEQDDWQETWTARTEEDSARFGGISLAGLLFGTLAAGLVMFGFQLVGNRLVSAPDSLVYTFLFIASGFISGMVGGLLVGWLSDDHHLAAAAVVGLLVVGISIVFEAYMRDLASESLVNPRVILIWTSILISVLLGGMLSRNRALRVDGEFLANEDDLYHDLIVKIGYDQSLAERLIEFERRRTPNAHRTALIRSAITRWERDNRL